MSRRAGRILATAVTESVATLRSAAWPVAMLRPLAEERDWDAFADLVTVADELAQARSWDEALWAYDIAVGIEPRDERALRNRAITLWRTGQDDRAAEAWRQVLEVLPRRP